jgi:hypothetical protein
VIAGRTNFVARIFEIYWRRGHLDDLDLLRFRSGERFEAESRRPPPAGGRYFGRRSLRSLGPKISIAAAAITSWSYGTTADLT